MGELHNWSKGGYDALVIIRLGRTEIVAAATVQNDGD